MNTHKHISAILLATAGMAAMTGCSSNPAASTASTNNNDMIMLQVAETYTVGKPVWVSQRDAIAIVKMKDAPLPANYLVVGLDQNRQITAVMMTTKYASHQNQGFKLLSGKLGENDDVVLPGSEYAVAMENTVKSLQEQRMNPVSPQETAGAAPASSTSASQQPAAVAPTI